MNVYETLRKVEDWLRQHDQWDRRTACFVMPDEYEAYGHSPPKSTFAILSIHTGRLGGYYSPDGPDCIENQFEEFLLSLGIGFEKDDCFWHLLRSE